LSGRLAIIHTIDLQLVTFSTPCKIMAIRDPVREKKQFAQNLIRLMRSANVKQKALARELGTTPRTIRRWHTETDTTWPPAAILPALARELGCSIDALYSFEPEWLPKTQSEREILQVVRKTPRNLPLPMITNAMSLILLRMSDDQRRAWMQTGNWIVEGNKVDKEK